MKAAKQRDLALHQTDCSKRVRKHRRPELVRLLAELLLQALGGDRARQGGAPWKR